jgi:hypothetical protein
MLLIAQHRKLDIKDVLCYPLGPKPWALANGDRTLKKTNKALLGKYIEKEIANVEMTTGASATIVNAMGTVQMVHDENFPFIELSSGSGRIDVVFDLYKEQSIKAAEKVNRGSKDGIVFNQIKPGHRIKKTRRGCWLAQKVRRDLPEF